MITSFPSPSHLLLVALVVNPKPSASYSSVENPRVRFERPPCSKSPITPPESEKVSGLTYRFLEDLNLRPRSSPG